MTWTACSTPTASCWRRPQAWLAVRHPRQPGDSDFVHRQAVKAKALDALRGLLPAASLSNVGIYGSGQSYEMLLLRMRSHPLPEAAPVRRHDAGGAPQGDPVVPPAGGPARPGRRLERVPRAHPAPDRRSWWRSCSPTWWRRPAGRPADRRGEPSVTLLDFDPDGEDKVIAAICAPLTDRPEEEVLSRVRPARCRGEAGAAGRLRRRPGEPPPPARPGLRAHRLPVRRGHRLRRLPRPPAPPDADHRVATTRDHTRVRRARRRRGGRPRPTATSPRWSGRASWPRPSPRCSRWSRPTPWPWPTASATRCR